MMMWFFALICLAVIVLVAVVAAGWGGSLPEAYDDRPDSRVQADRPLNAADLIRVRFSSSLRGYRMSEVDTLLDRLAQEMAQREAAARSQAGYPTPAEPATSSEPATPAAETTTTIPKTDEAGPGADRNQG